MVHAEVRLLTRFGIMVLLLLTDICGEATKDQTELQLLVKDEGKKTEASVEHRSKMLEELKQMMKAIMEQIKSVNEVKEKLVKQLSVENAIFEQYKRERERKLLEYKKRVEKKDEDGELFPNTETQLQSADELYQEMAEKMTQLKMDEEQVSIDVKEVEKKMKEIQQKEEEESGNDLSSSEPLTGSSSDPDGADPVLGVANTIQPATVDQSGLRE